MPLPETMRAAVLEELGKPLVFKDVPVPKPERGEIIVKLETCGVCHSDLHLQDGDWLLKPTPPVILGHEGVGRVVALGAEVEDLTEGDRVCVPWMHSACGRCELCYAGCENICEQWPPTATGFTVDGCFAEYVKAKADFVGRVADNLKSEDVAPVACAGITVYTALKRTEARPGQWVVIVGAAGGLGHLGIQYGKAMGLKVIGIDCGEEKLEFIRSLGAELALDARTADFKEQVLATTGGGAHGAIILVPVKTAVQDAIEYCRKRGTIVQIAIPPGDLNANIFMMIAKALTIRTSAVGTRLELKEALQFAADGKIKCNVSVRKFSEVNTLLDELRSGKVTGRLVMDMAQK